MIWDYIIGGAVILIIGLVIVRVIVKRKKYSDECTEFHSIYGIPDSELPIGCASCPAKMLCKENPGTPARRKRGDQKSGQSDVPGK